MLKYKNKSRFGLRLDARIKKTLEQLAELNGISSSGLIRMLIIKEKINYKEELQRRGLYNGELEN
jgi:hypothetical protein